MKDRPGQRHWTDDPAVHRPMTFWSDASGMASSASFVQPFTSGGGIIEGANVMTFRGANGEETSGTFLYSKTNSVGLDVGAAGEMVYAWGNGDWAGLFRSVNVSAGLFTGSVFWSPGEGGWFGVTGGFSFGLPGIAVEETNYELVDPQP